MTTDCHARLYFGLGLFIVGIIAAIGVANFAMLEATDTYRVSPTQIVALLVLVSVLALGLRSCNRSKSGHS